MSSGHNRKGGIDKERRQATGQREQWQHNNERQRKVPIHVGESGEYRGVTALTGVDVSDPSFSLQCTPVATSFIFAPVHCLHYTCFRLLIVTTEFFRFDLPSRLCFSINRFTDLRPFSVHLIIMVSELANSCSPKGCCAKSICDFRVDMVKIHDHQFAIHSALFSLPLIIRRLTSKKASRRQDCSNHFLIEYMRGR